MPSARGSASSLHPPLPLSSRSSFINCSSSFQHSSVLPQIQAIIYTVQPPLTKQPTIPIELPKIQVSFVLFTPFSSSHQLIIQFFDDDQHVRLALYPHPRSPWLGCRSVHHYLAYQRDLLGEYSVGLVVDHGDQSADRYRLSSSSLSLCSSLLLPYPVIHQISDSDNVVSWTGTSPAAQFTVL